MPAHFDKYFSKHKAQQLFDIVADVESYPQFLPWVGATKILERHENHLIVDMVVKFKSFSQKYTSRVDLIKQNKDGFAEIDVSLVRGPFKYLKTNWIFEPVENGTNIIFAMDFKFESMIFEKMIGFIFEPAVRKMTDSFIKRADEIIKD